MPVLVAWKLAQAWQVDRICQTGPATNYLPVTSLTARIGRSLKVALQRSTD